ncbi:hypothetical protein QFC20_006858 [Naganishia adeliensis]|uniref:Uncharacterized protein n=1 Tax=Naganishia adeliensis TaxID=92952 RepID=A0ACC2V680_9TREE|nr:hypothetical protein QFC20_006858 [Naganishia adeliensis]
MSLLTFFFISFTSLVQLVSATEANIGFRATINVTGIDIYQPDGQYYAGSSLRGPDTTVYTFVVPVTITRVLSNVQSLEVTLLSRLYDYEDEASGEVEVYRESIDMDGTESYPVTATFNIITSYNATDIAYHLPAQISIFGNAPGTNARHMQTTRGASVVAYNSSSGTWTPFEPAVFAHLENEANHAQHDAEMAKATEPGIDTTLETIIDNGMPALPEEDPEDGLVIEGPLTPVDNTTFPCEPVPCPPLPCDGEYDHGHDHGHGHGYSRRNNYPTSSSSSCTVKPTTTASHCRDFESWKRNERWQILEHDLNLHVMRNSHSAGLSARQATGNFFTVRLQLFYGTADLPVPVRQVQVTAFGQVGVRPIPAIGRTDDNGVVSLRFPAGSGDDSLLIYLLSVPLVGEKFRISTSADDGETFSFWRLVSFPLTWQVSPGETGDFTYRFRSKSINDKLNIWDRILTSWTFAMLNVANLRAKLPNVWFPGRATGLFFYPAATLPKAFLNVHPDQATYTTALAHEYGHWSHYATRDAKPLPSNFEGESHKFCQTDFQQTPSLSLKEGFATAFGLESLKGSRFQEDGGTGFCWFPFNPAVRDCVDIERYTCAGIADPDLSTDEGRVAAVFHDLVDIPNDNNGGDDDRGVDGFSDRIWIRRREVLYLPLKANPANMEQYWANFKAQPTLSAELIAGAWNIFEYQYAKFDE